MLAKLTSKNQLTLPKAVVKAMPASDYFDVVVENGRIVLTPVQIGPVQIGPVQVGAAEAVRAKLESLGLAEGDIADAVAWSRKRSD